jgi:hypothetical protein
MVNQHHHHHHHPVVVGWRFPVGEHFRSERTCGREHRDVVGESLRTLSFSYVCVGRLEIAQRPHPVIDRTMDGGDDESS